MRRLRAGAVALAAAAAVLGCGERPTVPGSDSVRLSLVPVFRQGAGLPVLPVDELRVRVTDVDETTVLAEQSVPVSPSDVEVEVELRLDVTPGVPVVVELALLYASQDVYTGGPVAVVPREQPVDIEVDYVGAGACDGTAGTANIGPVGGSPGVVVGEIELGDCYLDDTETFADRWTVLVPRDAGLGFFAEPTTGSTPLRLRLERLDGTVVVEGDTDAFSLFLGAGTYVAVVTTAARLGSSGYSLAVYEFDRCDSETGQLAPGVDVPQALTTIDCPLASGRAADLWGLSLSTATPYRIDLQSSAFDAFLLLTGPQVLDPFFTSPLGDDDDGGLGTNALLAGELPPGDYRVWATSFGPGETGAYQIAMRTLVRGAPTLEVRSVTSLGTVSQCGSAQGYLFEFGFEDGDGDLTEGGGVTIRLTGVPSGFQELKGLGWEDFSDEDLNPYAGYSEILTCETFGSDTSKLAEFFITDAQGRASAIYATTLSRPSAAPPVPAPSVDDVPVVRRRSP